MANFICNCHNWEFENEKKLGEHLWYMAHREECLRQAKESRIKDKQSKGIGSEDQRNKWRKGKTYEEIYGTEKAKELKLRSSECRKDKTLLEIYGSQDKVDNILNGFHSTKGKPKLALRGYKQSEEHIEKRSLAQKGKPKPEGFGEKIGQSRRGSKHTEETKLKMSLAHRGKKFTEEHIRNILKSNCTFPNKFEQKCLNHLNIFYPNKFKYTGDGSFIINNRSADAYSEELKIVVLFNGCYWHLNMFNFCIEDFLINRKSVEFYDSYPFLKEGYRIFIIWEDEMTIKEIKLENFVAVDLANCINFMLVNKGKMINTTPNFKDTFQKLGELIKEENLVE